MYWKSGIDCHLCIVISTLVRITGIATALITPLVCNGKTRTAVFDTQFRYQLQPGSYHIATLNVATLHITVASEYGA
ncbi:uncharacterized protein N7479_002428 [Penicillium vulpinum]|uniref:uncharacterized protein n=1 Tax=Penicillium vulpinum TaxID=29845 RepID=UPI002547D0EE|nr:uncharacterized protein N7479_002428 [Penicillium vulpinum]KAJ5972510.1 hypothetical protein N7479_002428 [Penicillium vulpinum]